MEEVLKLCPGCMREGRGENGVCKLCGFEEGQYTNETALPLGTMLNGKYVIGKVLGQGGFGITYIGLDLVLRTRVAIKELYPKRNATRNEDGTIQITNPTYVREFEAMKTDFLSEARAMAVFEKNSGIVTVKEYFMENDTAYIVMEYLEGQSLSQMVKKNGLMPGTQALELFMPVIKALANLHDEGMLHRDISPDNIVLTDDHSVKLIDFGTVKSDFNNSDDIYIKNGYSPIEQYQGRDAGTSTDVYALCATIYYVLTGKVPPKSTDRSKNDTLQPLSALANGLTPVEAMVIMQGLKVSAQDRIQNCRDLFYYLYVYAKDTQATEEKLQAMLHSKEIAQKVRSKKKVIRYHKRSKVISGILIALCVVATVAYLVSSAMKQQGSGSEDVVSDEVITTQAAGGTDNNTAQKQTQKSISELQTTCYQEINHKRAAAGIGEVIADETTEQLAIQFAKDIYETTETDLNTFCTAKAQELQSQYGIDTLAWMVAVEPVNATAKKAVQDLYNNEGNAAAIADASYVNQGNGISEEKNGSCYWVVVLSK